jgi:hypothetical protein
MLKVKFICMLLRAEADDSSSEGSDRLGGLNGVQDMLIGSPHTCMSQVVFNI